MSDCNVTDITARPKRQAGGRRVPALRSAVTNGSKLFVDGAHEGPWARRFRDLVSLHEEDLGERDTLSEGQLSLIRCVATLRVELEQMEGRMSKGEEVSIEVYQRSANTLRRLVQTLGLKRVAKDVTWRDRMTAVPS